MYDGQLPELAIQDGRQSLPRKASAIGGAEAGSDREIA